MSAYVLTRKGQTLETPSFINMLFSDKRFSILWLAVRVWLGWQWIEASLQKFSNPAWMKTGEALKGFWMGAVQIPAEGHPPLHLPGIAASFRPHWTRRPIPGSQKSFQWVKCSLVLHSSPVSLLVLLLSSAAS